MTPIFITAKTERGLCLLYRPGICSKTRGGGRGGVLASTGSVMLPYDVVISLKHETVSNAACRKVVLAYVS